MGSGQGLVLAPSKTETTDRNKSSLLWALAREEESQTKT